MLSLMKIDPERTMKIIAEDIVNKIGKNYGFMVLVFPFSDGVKTANYISNCSRDDMIKALREKADVLEHGLDIVGTSNEQ